MSEEGRHQSHRYRCSCREYHEGEYSFRSARYGSDQQNSRGGRTPYAMHQPNAESCDWGPAQSFGVPVNVMLRVAGGSPGVLMGMRVGVLG
jgi:hypothetical protein